MLIFVLSAICAAAMADDLTSLPKKWRCEESKRCIYTSSDNTVAEFMSQNICRLSCGRYGALWPRPLLETVLSHERTNFDPRHIRFNSNTHNKTALYLTETNRIFLKNVIKECTPNCSLLSGPEVYVKVSVTSNSLKLNWDTNESYNLTVVNTGQAIMINIKAGTVYGARHGIETLSQLITGNIGHGLLIVSSARIRDSPVYKHRGLLLDTARNFIPLSNIKFTLDAMAASKMNVFHWHATDSHSFPIEITRIPNLQRFGSYSENQVYTRKDMQAIVKYAKVRGIRVLIELDGPSHAGNGWQWGPMEGYGNLAVCVNQQPWRKFCIQPPCGQLNPVNRETYNVLNDVFADIAEIIAKEETIHMGGDEVFLDCWNSTQEIVQALIEKGMDTSASSFMKLWAMFHAENLKNWEVIKFNVTSSKKYSEMPVVVWSSHLTDPEVIENFLSKDKYIIQTWVEGSLPLNSQLLKKGYQIISSTKDAWYLDHGFWGRTQYYNWRKVYENRLQRDPGVLGGEVCLWTEYVDENSLDSRLWPRAGAAAERLWADPQTDSVQAEPRFYRYRDRLITRGIKADAVTPKWCTINELTCI